jgi:hypothetical protein
VRGVCEEHVPLDVGQPVGELLQQGDEGEVRQHQAALGVVQDPGDLVGEQARIDGVVDRAHAR